MKTLKLLLLLLIAVISVSCSKDDDNEPCECNEYYYRLVYINGKEKRQFMTKNPIECKDEISYDIGCLYHYQIRCN